VVNDKKNQKDIYTEQEKTDIVYSENGKPKKIRQYWRKMMDSTQKRMSRGSAKIARMISWARSDNWRGSGKDRLRKTATKKHKG